MNAFFSLLNRGINFAKIRGNKVTDYNLSLIYVDSSSISLFFVDFSGRYRVTGLTGGRRPEGDPVTADKDILFSPLSKDCFSRMALTAFSR